ncbi:MAG: hypothetical protein EZS28_041704 [Streblomastix strix]|uniref:Uncharacterized protein n=1 Tax=Streblomastix strix TaxID=222440 RepID=A0A5J4TY11_9EUKA|nr:MAG: hypothetical protein EZS28_041704 [Streblomastix strix]
MNQNQNLNEGIGLGQKMGTIDDSFFVPPPIIKLPQEQINELTKKLITEMLKENEEDEEEEEYADEYDEDKEFRLKSNKI